MFEATTFVMETSHDQRVKLQLLSYIKKSYQYELTGNRLTSKRTEVQRDFNKRQSKVLFSVKAGLTF